MVHDLSDRSDVAFRRQTDRLLYGDPRVEMTARYELVGAREAEEYNSGLRFTHEGG